MSTSIEVKLCYAGFMNERASYFSTSTALLFYKDRWHFCYLKGKDWDQIDSVNFVNPDRVESMKGDIFKNAQEKTHEEWPETLKEEAKAKILQEAEDYRPLFEKDLVTLVIGFTTDTLTSVPNDPEKIDGIVEAVKICIEKGPSGPYLRFKR